MEDFFTTFFENGIVAVVLGALAVLPQPTRMRQQLTKIRE